MELNSVFSLELDSFFDHLKTIRYGYQDCCGKLHFEGDPDFGLHDYVFSAPEEVVRNSCGWCWDVANLLSVYCARRGIEHITLFMEYCTPELHQTHTQVFLKHHSIWYPAPDNSAQYAFGTGGCDSFDACRERFVDTFRSCLKAVLRERYQKSQLLVHPVTAPIPAHISDEEYLELARNC